MIVNDLHLPRPGVGPHEADPPLVVDPERVNLDHTEVEITSKRGSAVLMSKDEYDSLVETSYLLRSPENARRLLSALASARDGEIEEHDFLEP
ncbi:type II toxin-antitoxin system Phd/YefM family antitoxin [Microbacterium gilvum]|uniref:type II toxin-antitoxin system Phd/YefM family antitoxin n=1 Tax=Microbacterium gilvum TaxID=1336204 RepID=UPI0031EA1E52